MTDKLSIADRNFKYGSFDTILQLLCAKCNDLAILDTTNNSNFVTSMWRNMVLFAKEKGWYVSKKHGIALCPFCRKEEGL